LLMVCGAELYRLGIKQPLNDPSPGSGSVHLPVDALVVEEANSVTAPIIKEFLVDLIERGPAGSCSAVQTTYMCRGTTTIAVYDRQHAPEGMVIEIQRVVEVDRRA